MDNLTKTLLSGAAFCALAVSPAIASVHLAISNGHNVLTLANGVAHSKTNFAGSKSPKTTYTNITQTVTFTYTGSESTMYKKKVNLGNPNGWLTATTGQPGVCQSIPGQKAKGKSSNAKIKAKKIQEHVTVASTTGGFPGCTGTVSQFEPVYELTNKNATQDAFVFSISKKKWTTSGGGHFNLKINEDWTVNID